MHREWIQPRPPQQRQQTARLYQQEFPDFLLTRRAESIGMTVVGSDSPGSWTLYVARSTTFTDAGIGSGQTLPTFELDIITGETFDRIDIAYPEVSRSGESAVEIRRGFATHIVASELVASIRYNVNEYNGTAPLNIASDRLTAWISPGFPVPALWVPDSLRSIPAPTFADAKPIPTFAQRVTARVRFGGIAATIDFRAPEALAPSDVVVVPADGLDHTFIVPAFATHVTSTGGGVLVLSWECVQ